MAIAGGLHNQVPNHPDQAPKGRTTDTKALRTLSSVTRSRPIELSIPAIHLAVRVISLGLNADGTVQVPSNGALPGWFRLGPSPGQQGSAVILGHIDSYRGPAVFYALHNLVVGNIVEVGLANGTTVRFKVIGLRMFLKAHFPARLVYGPRRYSALQLVTCGGVFDPSTGHYLSNTVVFTSRVP